MECKVFVVGGPDNDTYFFYDRTDVRRCKSCRELLDKWNETIGLSRPLKRQYDVSASYDGVVVVSEKFKQLYESRVLTGLALVPLGFGYYSARGTNVVTFDAERRGTRFEDQCPTCGKWKSVTGATPAAFRDPQSIPVDGFARTDLEFASGDEKHPLLLCGESAARELRKGQLRGLEIHPADQP